MKQAPATLLMVALAFVATTRLVGQEQNSTPQSLAEQQLPDWPGQVSRWNEFEKYDFEVAGRSAYVVRPRHPAPGNPWVWRARFPNFHAAADLILLERGFHIARIDTDGMLGSPAAMEIWNEFYQFVTNRGLAKRCALEGVSRGGLFVYGFASRWPDRVACIYADTPVCDIRSWPGGKGSGLGHAPTWQSCLQQYGLTEESAKSFAGNPIDQAAKIVDARIPLLHIVSLSDLVVPPEENTFVLKQRIEKLGGKLQVIEVERGTEQSNGHHFTHPDPVRVADFIERHATVLPVKREDFFQLGSGLQNSLRAIQSGQARVAFVGGSITRMDGWRDLVKDYLQQRFPQTKFEFVEAGIPSTGSVPGAFRLNHDVLTKGQIDLLFEEASVNDLTNGRTPQQRIRGMEGIVRRARIANPQIDIVMMHFVCPQHMADYRSERTPATIVDHQRVADHYQVATIDLAREVTERIDAGQFDWKHDFRNLHPSPYGHRIYASTIRRCLSAGWDRELDPGDSAEPTSLPSPLDRFSYDQGEYVSLNRATSLNGFQVLKSVDPRSGGVGGGVRPGFVDVPMLVGTKPGDSFEFRFRGRGVGLFVAAGPDAGVIEFRIDGGKWQRRDLFTRWSGGLHLPWAHVLADELEGSGQHSLEVRVAQPSNPSSRGTACRVVQLLVNGPETVEKPSESIKKR